jgi:anti-sigma factor RsiW
MRKLDCEEAERLLDAFQDNELDSVTSLAVQEHFDDCTCCRRLYQWNAESRASLQRLREATPSGSDALRGSVLEIAARDRRMVWFSLRRPALAAAAAIAVLLGIAGVAFQLRVGESPDVMFFVADHLRALARSEPVELRTSEPREAERWLQARLPFAATVPIPPAFRLLGVRLCKVRGEPAGFLLYDHDGRLLTCYLNQRSQTALRGFDTTTPSRVKVGTCEGKNIAAWDADHTGYVLVGDMPRESLVAFANSARHAMP